MCRYPVFEILGPYKVARCFGSHYLARNSFCFNYPARKLITLLFSIDVTMPSGENWLPMVDCIAMLIQSMLGLEDLTAIIALQEMRISTMLHTCLDA